MKSTFASGTPLAVNRELFHQIWYHRPPNRIVHFWFDKFTFKISSLDVSSTEVRRRAAATELIYQYCSSTPDNTVLILNACARSDNIIDYLSTVYGH